MIDLTGWSLFIDILLMGSLVFLAYRLTKAESVAVKIDRVGDLEKTLRKIINESQEASIDLDQKLRSRQKDLEVLLTDLQSLESRVSGSFKESKAIKDELDLELENGKLLIKKIISLVNVSKQEKQTSLKKPIISDDNRIETIEDEINHKAINLTNEVNEEKPEKQYIVKDSFIKQPEKTQPLAKKIEREVIDLRSSQTGDLAMDRMTSQRLYDLAEGMLKRGASLQIVSQRTNLSLDEVEKIRKIVVSNDENENENKRIVTSNDDARLGVLSKMRREITTL